MRRVLAVLALGILLAAACGTHQRRPTVRSAPTISIRPVDQHYGGPPPGSPAVGDVLYTTPGSWSGSPTGFAYLWEDCDSSGANCATAAGSPTNTQRYQIVCGDVSSTIRVQVTASYSGHPNAAVQSAATATVATGDSCSPFPVKISSNDRYLETASGSPFLMVGDSPQSAFDELSASTFSSFMADREAEGFNTAYINLLCTSYTFCQSSGEMWDPGTSSYDIAPFTSGSGPGNYDLSTPNSTYFSRIDTDINAAAADNIQILLNPAETGGWLGALEGNGNGGADQSGTCPGTGSKDYCYGVYLGNRYKSFPNIIWFFGNDFQTWQTAGDDNDVLAVAKGIQSVDTTHLITTELNWHVSYSNNDSNWSSLLGLDGAYTYAATYNDVRDAYASTPTAPVFLEEANYEGEQISGLDGCAGGGIGATQTGADVINCRKQEWWTMTSGATGQLYGNYYTDAIGCGCDDDRGAGGTPAQTYTSADIDTVGVTELGYQTGLLEALGEWYNLAPDTGHTLVTAGYGTAQSGCSPPTFSSVCDFSSDTYVTDAETPDKTLALAYDPGGSTLTVDFGNMAGSTTARWYDPTNNTFTAIGGSPFSISDTSQSIATPGTNNAGDDDWVLVLQG